MQAFVRNLTKMIDIASGRGLEALCGKVVTEGTFRNWIKNGRPNSTAKAEALAEALGLTYQQLIGGEVISDTWWVNLKTRCNYRARMRKRIVAWANEVDVDRLSDDQILALRVLLGDRDAEAN